MWWFHAPLLLALPLLFLLLLPQNVTARFCEGGHICSLPRECCTQGCCPPYQGGPRQLPPPSEHVLNLFFISHWFFWCVVVAVILAILCAYSLWKKRRTLCGWGFNEHHTQSEGDSAGSCYAPPQYSRCNSFHHPPPPYTEVTSKPDLYPLVFTCNSDNGKGNGSSSYLMVQYFRNYIVRPAGSLSAASTVDSLSSSFICNANEANTLVPPPYSRAASPELGLHHYVTHAPPPQQPPPAASNQLMAGQYGLPRSASQLVDSSTSAAQIQSQAQAHAQAHAQAQAQAQAQHYATVALGGNGVLYSTRLQSSQSGNFSPEETVRSGMGMSPGMGGYHLQSQSDQHFRYMATSSSSLSDIFVNNSCVAGLGSTMMDGVPPTSGTATQAASLSSLAAGGTPVIYSNGCIQPNPLHNLDTCCQLSGPAGAAAAGGVGGAIGGASGTTVSSAASGVSSLANIGTPSSPPQATSPTGEVREILDQIRQLQAGVSYEQLLLGGELGGGATATPATGTKPRLQHTLSTPAAATPGAATSGSGSVSASVSASSSISGKSKKFYAPKPPNKALYIPMAALVTSSNGSGSSGAQRCVLKSPVSSVVSGASFFVNRGRVARKGWISRSAPTTPGSGLPPNRLGDDSPLLLNEHDEDVIEDDDEENDDDDDDDDDAIVYGCPEMAKNAREGARGRVKINSKNKAQTRNRLQGQGQGHQGQGQSRHHNELE